MAGADTMKAATLLLTFAAGASAFLAPAPKVQGRTKGVATMAISKAIPFLQAPAKLDGSLVGDYGFDPMGISDQVADLKYVRASELKHGRVAMLAVLGWFVESVFHLPGDIYSAANPLEAVTRVPLLSHIQIFAFIAAVELATLDATYTSAEPWNLGFDPLGFSKNKSADEIKSLELKEIKNGRLAMVAFIGLLVQELVVPK